VKVCSFFPINLLKIIKKFNKDFKKIRKRSIEKIR
jgi:hypothetical protein